MNSDETMNNDQTTNVVLSRELIELGGTPCSVYHGRQQYAWNRAQLTALGVTDGSRGWIERLIGTEVPREDYARFLALKTKKGR